MKQEIRTMLEEQLPLVDFDSDFLFTELDSLGIAQILISLSQKYNIELSAKDVTPKNFKSLDSLVEMVEDKIK